MLFLRDIHTGLGERNSFRMTFNLLCNLDLDLAKRLLPLIPKYGRWDDILSGLNTKVEDDVIKLIKKILIIDLKKQEEKEKKYHYYQNGYRLLMLVVKKLEN